ncbi:hypothetical protein [Streptococcus agalactiae]|uniref:hypothetical protein n=1 Tax=Streptococcus agalactiae TaxID=1311 RepID=UPI00255588CF|nr:hypothetical protein [Streptococcus agalactiae]
MKKGLKIGVAFLACLTALCGCASGEPSNDTAAKTSQAQEEKQDPERDRNACNDYFRTQSWYDSEVSPRYVEALGGSNPSAVDDVRNLHEMLGYRLIGLQRQAQSRGLSEAIQVGLKKAVAAKEDPYGEAGTRLDLAQALNEIGRQCAQLGYFGD